jgi:hypothetical protein
MAPNDEIELGILHHDAVNLHETSQRGSTVDITDGHLGASDIEHEFSLPPVDGGKAAWSFLGAAFMVEVLVWGI